MSEVLEVIPNIVDLAERVIVAPCAGRFEPLPPEVFTTEGEWVSLGTMLAVIKNGPEEVEVRSHTRGWVMGMLAIAGQPVRAGEALFWVRAS